MAENKQYIEQIQENGSVMISEDVIAVIVTQAVNEVEGTAGLSSKPGTDIVEMFGGKSLGRGMKITIAEDNSLTISCNVSVKYGQSVVDVAKAVQQSITAAVESMTGAKVMTVNVNVCGIVRQ